MVNHIETVLLNRSPVELGGVLPWHFDDSYLGRVAVPAGVSAVYDALAPDRMRHEDRVDRVLSVSGLVRGLVDMAPFVSAIDERTTIPHCSRGGLAGLHGQLLSARRGRLDISSFVSAASLSSGIRAPVGNPPIDKLVSDLVGILTGSREAVLRFSSGVLLLVIQLGPAYVSGRRPL